jgi:hypothetical protein
MAYAWTLRRTDRNNPGAAQLSHSDDCTIVLVETAGHSF